MSIIGHMTNNLILSYSFSQAGVRSGALDGAPTRQTELSVPPQRGQALAGVLDFGQTRVGVLPEIEEFPILLPGLDLLPFFLIDAAQPVVKQRMDEEAELVFGVDGHQPPVF